MDDKKGQELVNVLSCLPLLVANRPISEQPFTPSNTAFIGVSLTGDNASCSQWPFLDYPSPSHHPYITYTISHSSSPSSNYRNHSSSKSFPKLIYIDLELPAFTMSTTHVPSYLQTTCEKNIDYTTALITSTSNLPYTPLLLHLGRKLS